MHAEMQVFLRISGTNLLKTEIPTGINVWFCREKKTSHLNADQNHN